MKNILVTGGAGYMGSLAVKKLLDLGHKVTVIDNLYSGKREFVDRRATFHKLDILDLPALEYKFINQKFNVIIHFAALKCTGESMKKSDLYQNNIIGVMNLLKIAPKLNVKKFVFSSTSFVYGETGSDVVDENHICSPSNFYGYTKLAGEHLLEWMRKLNHIEYVALRCFNVVGDGGLNYKSSHDETIFTAIAEVISKKRKFLKIFGNNFNTPDGTGMRDYVHVSDIADAHIMAMDIKGSYVINIASEKPYSVFEILKEFEKITHKKIPYKIVKKREGDVSTTIVANSTRAKNILKWRAKLGLADMVESSLQAYNSKSKKV